MSLASTSTPPRVASPAPTPSKKATAALDAMSLMTPTKLLEKASVDLVDDDRRSCSPDPSAAATEEDLEQYRDQWIGEVDLPERMHFLLVSMDDSTYLLA